MHDKRPEAVFQMQCCAALDLHPDPQHIKPDRRNYAYRPEAEKQKTDIAKVGQQEQKVAGR